MNAKTLTGTLLGLVVGAILALAIVWFSAPSMMMMVDESPYGFEETVAEFQAAADEAGWSVLEARDMQAVVANHGADVDPVMVFDLCSSRHSIEILEQDDERIVTPMMPCRVSIYETSDGTVHVARMNSGLVARTFGGLISDVMQTASGETEAFIATVVN
ncbi:MAG: DUF302 domain-containing protein [Trueperaceae bacterium]|nr:DUF302 domain-containing protein [Trueperaceae bacterium]